MAGLLILRVSMAGKAVYINAFVRAWSIEHGNIQDISRILWHFDIIGFLFYSIDLIKCELSRAEFRNKLCPISQSGTHTFKPLKKIV